MRVYFARGSGGCVMLAVKAKVGVIVFFLSIYRARISRLLILIITGTKETKASISLMLYAMYVKKTTQTQMNQRRDFSVYALSPRGPYYSTLACYFCCRCTDINATQITNN